MIEIDNACVAYDGMRVLRGVSLTVEPGELVALVGDNGCGKSTLGRVVCAVQLVDGGSVSIDGHDPSVSELERLRVRELVGYVQQDPFDQIVSSLVFDEVAFGPRNLGLDEDEVTSRVAESLVAVGLAGFEDRVTAELSGGEQQRLALAGVLAMRPRYLVLDEPTAQLDPFLRVEMRGLFARLAHEHGIGVLLITHDSEEIAIADRTVHLDCASNLVDRVTDELDLPHVEPEAGVALEMSGVSFSYGHQRVLNRIDLRLHAGEVALLTGVSGAGKSTLASIAAGLREPDAGTVLVDGAHVQAGYVGLSFQNPEAQFFLDTVYEEIAFAPRNMGCEGAEVDRLVHEAARMVGLDANLLDRYPFELSGGQARRVALASVLSLDAPVYIFDEPSAALDAAGRTFAHRLVCELSAAGKAVIVITHDVGEWRPFAHRELVLEGGFLVDAERAEGDAESANGVEPAVSHLEVNRVNPGCDLQDERIGNAAGRNGDALERTMTSASRAVNAPQDTGRFAPFGGFVPGSRLSCIDARVKIVLLLAASVGVFASSVPAALLAWFIVLAACLVGAGLNAASVLRGVKPVAIVLMFTLIANLVSCDGRADVVLAGTVGLSVAGGLRGLTAVMRILLLVGFSLAVAVSTTATQISDAAVRLMRPLAHLGMPVAPLGMVFSLALRFIPLVGEELQRIRLSQRARGARFDEGPLVHRIGVWSSVLMPLMVGLMRRADRLAEAMEARCYGAVASGRLPAPHPLSNRDKAVLAFGLLTCIFLVILSKWAQ